MSQCANGSLGDIRSKLRRKVFLELALSVKPSKVMSRMSYQAYDTRNGENLEHIEVKSREKKSVSGRMAIRDCLPFGAIIVDI